jgi:glycosyltransferase involved in cell wall biosynthesis
MLAEGLPAEWLGEQRARPTGTPVVLWVGRFLARKAPALAVEAFAELRRRMPARLVMAGDGPLLEQTRSLVDRLGLAQDVELLGRVPWTEINELYDSATAFLFTSLRDSSGSQFLEALGRGLPAVALNHHGIGDADVGAAAIKVDLPAEPAELPALLGEALHDVLTDDAWSERSAGAVDWAAQHTWPAKAARATTIYADVLGAHSPSAA